MNLLKKLLNGGGVRVPHHKDTANVPTEQLPLPAKIVLPMSQHVGAPCLPCVKKGDRVLMGQVIGEPVGGIGIPVHASVSGTVPMT